MVSGINDYLDANYAYKVYLDYYLCKITTGCLDHRCRNRAIEEYLPLIGQICTVLKLTAWDEWSTLRDECISLMQIELIECIDQCKHDIESLSPIAMMSYLYQRLYYKAFRELRHEDEEFVECDPSDSISMIYGRTLTIKDVENKIFIEQILEQNRKFVMSHARFRRYIDIIQAILHAKIQGHDITSSYCHTMYKIPKHAAEILIDHVTLLYRWYFFRFRATMVRDRVTIWDIIVDHDAINRYENLHDEDD